MSNPFPCNSIGNAQCAMANEIQRYGPNLIPLALKSRAKLNRRCGDEEVLLHLVFKHHYRHRTHYGEL
jgi:hypothetical protein